MAWWNRARSGGSGCAARVPRPARCKQSVSVWVFAHSYLLLQPYYTRPFLLQQPLILFPRSIVEAVGYVGFLPESLGSLWRVYDTQICYYGLVPGSLSVVTPAIVAICHAHSSSACRSVNIALMAEQLAHTRLVLIWTMHYRKALRSLVRPMRRRFLVGAGNCGERRMDCRGGWRGILGANWEREQEAGG